MPKPPWPTPSTPPPAVEVGSVLCTAVSPASGRPADRAMLREQFLHKAVRRLRGHLQRSGTPSAPAT